MRVRLAGGLVAASLVFSCSEPVADTSSMSASGGASSATDGMNADATTGDAETAHVVVEDVGWLCSTDPQTIPTIPIEEDLFRHKRRLRLTPGRYDVLAGEPIPFEYVFEGVERPLVLGVPEVSVETGFWGTTPHGWHIDEEDGTTWQTLKYVQRLETDPPTMPASQPNAVLLVSRDTAEPGHDFVFTLQRGLAAYSGLLGPCEPPTPTDVVRVDFEQGQLTLETRRGWYASGFLMTARGTVEGIEVDVEERGDLGLYPHDIDMSYFGLPTFAVRWPDTVPASGECGLVIKPDVDSGEYSAWFIDCELRWVRDVVVEALEVEFGD